MSRKLIGFLGKAGVGKTTLANAIIEMGQYPFQKYAFADGVREIARKAFPQYGFKKPYSSNERDILVAVGQTAREIHPNYWVELLGKKIQDKSYVIIDDIRFQNEVDFLKNQGFLIVKLECSDYIRQKRIGDRKSVV